EFGSIEEGCACGGELALASPQVVEAAGFQRGAPGGFDEPRPSEFDAFSPFGARGDAWADVAGTPPLPYLAWACLLCAAERWLEQMFHVKQSGEDLRLETAFRKTRLRVCGSG
ncbi:MAG: hypothetical protein ACLR67_09810, partial [Eggerthella lenta]